MAGMLRINCKRLKVRVNTNVMFQLKFKLRPSNPPSQTTSITTSRYTYLSHELFKLFARNL